MALTNDGKSTSAATTLKAESRPQNIRESYTSASVLALEPGASRSTTLDITVPSAETDQSALLEVDYGTAFRRLTVIVP